MLLQRDSLIGLNVRQNDSNDTTVNLMSRKGTGTRDFVPYLSIIWAINFRKCIGGEGRIMEYCRNLAIAGGQAMASILGTRILDDTPNYELTAAMVRELWL